MNFTTLKSLKNIGRSIAVVTFISISGMTSFATLGDGNKKASSNKPALLSSKTIKPGYFTLRSGYTYRGTQVITQQAQRYISLNTKVTYQKGNTTYIVPLKKKVLLTNVKIDVGNRQFRRN